MSLCLPAVPWARFHQRPLQLFILQNWDGAVDSLERSIWLPDSAKRSLWWWRMPKHISCGLQWVPLVSKKPMMDAWGWGAHLDGQRSHGNGALWKQQLLQIRGI